MLRQSLDLQGASGIKAQRTDLIGGSRLSTGRLVLLDASQRALLYVDSAGRLTDVVRIGGEAEPFARPWWMGQCGKDSLFVWDAARMQMSVYNESGVFLDEHTFPRSGPASSPLTIVCSSEAFAYHPIAAQLRPTTDSVPYFRGTAPITVESRTNGSSVEISSVPTVEMVELTVAGRRGGVARPLGRPTSLAIVAHRLYAASGDSATVDVWRIDGAKLPRVRTPASRGKPTDLDYLHAVDEASRHVPSALRDESVRQLLRIAAPATTPPYARILADREGVLWIVRSMPGEHPTVLIPVDSSGLLGEALRLPGAVNVLEIGQDYLLGIEESGQQTLSLYRLYRR